MTYKIKDIFRRIKFGFQRMFRGYDDSAYWGLSDYIGDIALPVLRTYKENGHGTPYTGDDEKGEATFDEDIWQQELTKMIVAFEWMKEDNDCSDKYMKMCEDNMEELIKIQQEGFESFGKYFKALWD